MTQQDAYQKITEIVDQIALLIKEAKDLAAEHEVEFECSSYFEVVDPEDAWESSDSWDDSGC